MVRVTALGQIIRFIDEKELKPMIPWGERYGREEHQRKCRYVRKLLTNIRRLLNLISGGDLIEMLKAVLFKSEIEELYDNRKEKKALENLANCYIQTDLKKRHYLARALKKSGISRSRIRRYGFNVSKNLWSTCIKNQEERNPGGGKKISEPLRQAIKSYLHENSSISSNRLVINKDKDDQNFDTKVSARFLEKNQIELYKEFPLAKHMSKETFFKYLRKSREFKKPHRLTDLCDYCEKGKELEKKISKGLEVLKYDWQDRVDMRFVQHFLKQKEPTCESEQEKMLVKELSAEVDYYDAILYHKNIARAQREAYNRDRTDVDVLRNKIMIDVDFKQKIVLGAGPREINSDFYDSRNRSRTCLGFGIYYVDETNTIKTINFNIIASDDSQEARAVVRGFRILRQEKFFKDIEKPNYIIWMDCGKHFRNSLVSGYLLKELTKESVDGVKIRTNMNFFCEKHGKSMRDAHFSMLAKFITDASMQKRLICTDDIKKAIENGQLLANQNRLRDGNRIKDPKNTEPVRTIVYALEYDKLTQYIKKFNKMYTVLKIPNIENLYNYRAYLDENELLQIETSVLSNQSDLIKLNLKITDIGSQQLNYDLPNKDNFEDVLTREPLLSGLDYIKNKKVRVNYALSLGKKERFYRETPVKEENKDNLKLEIQNDVQKPPQFCRVSHTGLKQLCNSCKSECNLSLERLIKDQVSITVVNKELKDHFHPTFRPGRNKNEAVKELIAHYVYAHKITLPENTI